MAAEGMDMSLEDLIKKNRKTSSDRGGPRGGRSRGGGLTRGRGGGSRRGGGGGGGAPRGNINGRWSHDMYGGGGGGGGGRAVQSGGPARCHITNLDYGVSDADIRELFSEFGAMRSGAVHYDRSGRSLGTALVIFDRMSDGQKAIKQYNGVHLDGRPMTIALEGQGGGSRGKGPATKRLQPAVNGARRGISRGRGGSRGRGRGGKRDPKEPPKSADDLDKELEDYVKEAKAATATEA